MSERKRMDAIWRGMHHRCSDKYTKNYKNYFLRGITVCERWNDFENFYKDMGPRPNPKLSMDRIDNDKGYSPENCRWATRSVQNKNQRRQLFPGTTGVYRIKDRKNGRAKKWQARYNEGGKSKSLGCHFTFDEARAARLNYEVQREVIDSGLFEFLCN